LKAIEPAIRNAISELSVRPRDHTADDLVDELVALVSRQRLELDVAVAELPAPARLLLVAALCARLAADRLEVGNARRVRHHLDAEAPLEAVDGHLDVHLREARHDQLAGPFVARKAKRRILLGEAAERLTHLLVVALRARLHRDGDDRRGQRHGIDREVAIGVGQHVARQHVLQLRDGADVARSQIRHRRVLPPLEREDLPDALLVMRALVDERRLGPDPAGEDAQQAELADVRVGDRLEAVRGNARALELEHDVVARPVVRVDAFGSRRRRQAVDDQVEQRARPHVAGRRTARDGEELAPHDEILEREHELVVGDRLALEVALHQIVGGLGDVVHQALAPLLGLLAQLVGNRHRIRLVAAVGGVLVGHHVQQVDDAAEAVLLADREADRDQVLRQLRLQRRQRRREVGALAVEQVDEGDPRQPELLAALPQAHGGDLDSEHPGDDEQRTLDDP
jgi:hypothetical protein